LYKKHAHQLLQKLDDFTH